MKEKYLEDLKEALANLNIQDEEILNTYTKRFELGHEAGLNDEEIIEMLGSVDDVVAKYHSTSSTCKKRLNCSLDFANLFSDFAIVSSKEPGISFQFDKDDDVENYVAIKISEDEISLKANNATKKHHFEGTMIVGPDICFDKFVICGVDTDLQICNLNMNTFNFSLVNGDVNFKNITALQSVNLSVVTGDVMINSIVSPEVAISTTSGDVDIDEITADSIKLNTVSGDININRSNEAKYKINTVSGDVTIRSGADLSLVSSASVSGEVTVSGKSSGKTVSDIINDTFKKIKIF